MLTPKQAVFMIAGRNGRYSVISAHDHENGAGPGAGNGGG
jgi:hypothetical protein